MQRRNKIDIPILTLWVDVSSILQHAGLSPHSVRPVASVEECVDRAAELDGTGLILGPPPGGQPLAPVVERLLSASFRLPVLVLTPRPDPEEAFRMAGLGVDAYVGWREDGTACERCTVWLRRLWAASCEAMERDIPFVEGLVGRSRAMKQVAHLIRLIAPRQSTVLITGDTGTGKELVAQAIHQASPRARRPLVVVNSGAIPENLVEAELFGHAKGAFTGAVQARAGRFEQADGGTIFLDEVGELPLEAQAKLLRVLQEREVQRIGGIETTGVDVRVIAATHRDLRALVERGEFREDLYYRLNVVPIHLPSLAERTEDIPSLAGHLLSRICSREGLAAKVLSPQALERLTHYPWPGNVRQLENALEKAAVLSAERRVLHPGDFALPPGLPAAPAEMSSRLTLPPAGIDLDSLVRGIERTLLQQALRRAGGNKKRAAELLRIKRTTFGARWRNLRPPEAAVEAVDGTALPA